MRHHLILRVVVKLLVAPIVLFALYVQFHGDYSPGGGFQAGVILAVAFILYGIVFGLVKVQQVFPPWLVHKFAALGVLVYAGTGVLSLPSRLLLSRLWGIYPTSSRAWSALGNSCG